MSTIFNYSFNPSVCVEKTSYSQNDINIGTINTSYETDDNMRIKNNKDLLEQLNSRDILREDLYNIV